MRRSTTSRRSLGFSLLALAGLALASAIINPVREMMPRDDGWAYARSVQHLVETGVYRLDIWSAANMPVQIYIAAGFAKVFGYSLTLLRLTTMALLATALVSFYALARDLGIRPSVSAAGALGLLASPLVMLLGFTFMSDVQFVSWFVLALWLYVRGLRSGKMRTMFLASVACACAIGTRQFGIALVGGLVASWLLARRDARVSPLALLAGLALPAVAAAWQIRLGLEAPNFTQSVRLFEQQSYLANGPMTLAREALWRTAILVQYLGLACAPALPLILCGLHPSDRKTALRLAMWTLGGVVLLTIGLAVGSSVTLMPAGRTGRLWQPLGLMWLLRTHLELHKELFRLIDLAGLAAGGALFGVAAQGVPALLRSARLRPELLLLSVTPFCLLGLHIVYVQLNDTYVTPFEPFAVLLLAWWASRVVWPLALGAAQAIAFAFTVILAGWIRADYDAVQRAWSGADDLITTGVPRDAIRGQRHWMEYHGAFDEWVRAGAPGYRGSRSSRPGYDSFHDPFYAWLDRRDEGDPYRVQAWRESGLEWRTVREDPYRSFTFRRGVVYTYQRRPLP